MEVMSISVFGLCTISPPPLIYPKRTRKAETFLRKLSESRDREGPHENGLAKFAQTAPSSTPPPRRLSRKKVKSQERCRGPGLFKTEKEDRKQTLHEPQRFFNTLQIKAYGTAPDRSQLQPQP